MPAEEYQGEADLGVDLEPPSFAPINFADLDRQRPERGPAVIEGVLREGALATIVSGSKCRKSFLVGALMAATLSGGAVPWLSYPVSPGRVCLVDGELTLATIYFRFRKIMEALGINLHAARALDIFSMRGKTKKVGQAISTIRAKGPGYYKLIVIDPVSAFYPDDPNFNENDNAQMRRFYDDLLNFATETRAAVVNIHHAAKGSQSDKNIADVGAGAGAIARASDAHLIIRPHQEKDVVVFDGVLRDFPEIVPTCWRWSFPTFIPAPELSPDDLAGKRRARGKVEEFLAGAEPPAEPWTPTRFAQKFINQEPKTLPRLQAEASELGISNATVDRFARQAVALNLAYEWPGQPGRNGYPKRFANVPENLSTSIRPGGA